MAFVSVHIQHKDQCLLQQQLKGRVMSKQAHSSLKKKNLHHLIKLSNSGFVTATLRKCTFGSPGLQKVARLSEKKKQNISHASPLAAKVGLKKKKSNYCCLILNRFHQPPHHVVGKDALNWLATAEVFGEMSAKLCDELVNHDT